MNDLRNMAERDDGKPIYMVNLIKWRAIHRPAGLTLPQLVPELDTV